MGVVAVAVTLAQYVQYCTRTVAPRCGTVWVTTLQRVASCAHAVPRGTTQTTAVALWRAYHPRSRLLRGNSTHPMRPITRQSGACVCLTPPAARKQLWRLLAETQPPHNAHAHTQRRLAGPARYACAQAGGWQMQGVWGGGVLVGGCGGGVAGGFESVCNLPLRVGAPQLIKQLHFCELSLVSSFAPG